MRTMVELRAPLRPMAFIVVQVVWFKFIKDPAPYLVAPMVKSTTENSAGHHPVANGRHRGLAVGHEVETKVLTSTLLN